MFGGRAFFNIFRDSRTSLDSIRDKLVTLISFVIVQCPSIGTTWFGASCGRNGVLADLRGREGGGFKSAMTPARDKKRSTSFSGSENFQLRK